MKSPLGVTIVLAGKKADKGTCGVLDVVQKESETFRQLRLNESMWV